MNSLTELPCGSVNLALGRPYTTLAAAYNAHSYDTSGEKGTQLTDGVFGEPKTFGSGSWAHYIRAVGRTVTIDLGAEHAVCGYAMGFIQNRSLGIYCPTEFSFALSADGEDFRTVSVLDAPVSNTADCDERIVYRAVFPQAYRARYARFTFNVAVNSFADEAEVFGGEMQGWEPTLPPAAQISYAEEYLPREALGGVHDIACFHFGYWPDDPSKANTDADGFLPYLGYRGADGSYTDTLFDAAMFFIIQGKCPSGGLLTQNGGPSVISDWHYILDNLFDPHYNLSALNEATGRLKTMLSLPDTHRTAVYVAMPHPKISDLPFGDWTGNDAAKKIRNIEDMLAATSWYLDEVNRRFREADYRNLDLKGIFWCTESIINEYTDTEEEFTSRCVPLIHEKGLQAVFIPLYQALGIQNVHKIGFDAALMQPNLSFDSVLQARDHDAMMKDFTATARKFGLGIEMEIHHGYFNDREKWGGIYQTYMRTAARAGMMKNTIHAYYQGAGPGIFHDLALSKNPADRALYDDIYRFIKGTYQADNNQE